MRRGSLPPLEDDFSRALLGSAEADGPSNAAYAKAAAGLGIGVGLGVGASLPAPAAVAVGAAGMAGIARWSSWLGAKLVALGVCGALLVGSGVLLLRNAQPSKPVTQKRVPALHAAQVPREKARAAPVSPTTTRELSALPLVSSPRSPSLSPSGAGSAAVHPRAALSPARRVAHATAGSPARVSTGSSLAEQVQSLDRARVALGSGDSSSALREIAHYRVLEIEALAARGERSLAATRAADFVAAHPDSPQADRLRALIPAQKR